ncbi:MAG: hypothetical protein ABEN55_07575, partial [Bradymonadaceae bacterium]
WVTPFAFSNPIFVDADGGGYDNPHLEEEAESPPMAGGLAAPKADDEHDHPHPHGKESLTPEELKELVESLTAH